MTKHDKAKITNNFFRNLRSFTSNSRGRESEITSKENTTPKNLNHVTNDGRCCDCDCKKPLYNLHRTYKRQGESLLCELIVQMLEDTNCISKLILKNYTGKPGDGALLHELESFPLGELRGKFGTKLTWNDNDKRKPKKAGFVHQFKEKNSWTNDHERINFKDDLAEACFKILDMGKTRYFDLVRVVEMCQKFGFEFGDHYTAMTKEVYRGGNEEHNKCVCTFIMFKNVQYATIGGYFLGGLASKNCFWKQWGSSPFIWDQFEMPGGDDSTYLLNWENAGTFVANTQAAFDKFYTVLKNYNMGDLRKGMFATKWKYNNTILKLHGIKAMHVNYESLPGHFSTILNPRLVDNQFAIPSIDRRSDFLKKVKNGEFVMHNTSRAPIKFWRSYNDVKAKAFVTRHNKIADAKNAKFNQDKRVDKMRRINKNGLAETSMDNKFLRPSDVNYMIHDSIINVLQYELWLQFSPDELFLHTQLVAELRTPAAQLRMMKDTTLEEYEEMVMMVNAGMTTSEPVMQLFHSIKKKTKELDEERKRENRYIAKMVEKIGKNNSNREFALQSKISSISENFFNFFENKPFTKNENQNNFLCLGNKVLGQGGQIANISQMFEAIHNRDDNKYQALKRELDEETSAGFESKTKKIKLEDILEGKNFCSTPVLSEESSKLKQKFTFKGKLLEDSMDTDENDEKNKNQESDLTKGFCSDFGPISESSDDLISLSNNSDRHIDNVPTLEGDSCGGDTFSRESGSRAEGDTLLDIDLGHSLYLDSCERIRKSDLGGVDDIVSKMEQVGQADKSLASFNASSLNSSELNEISKVSSETTVAFKTPEVKVGIKLKADLEEEIRKVAWKDFSSNRKRPFISNGSFALNLVDKFNWKMRMVPDHKNQFKRQLVTAKGDRFRWHGLVLGYSSFVSRILFTIMEITLPGDDVKEEIQALIRAVKLYQTANDDRTIFTTLKNSKKHDEYGEYGIKALPVVSEAVFNTVMEAIRFISDEITVKFVLPSSSAAFAKRVIEVEKGRVQVTKREKAEDLQAKPEANECGRSEGRIIADRQYFFPGDELQEQFDLSNINFQNPSDNSLLTSNPLLSISNMSSSLQMPLDPVTRGSSFFRENISRILNLSTFSESSNVYPDMTINDNPQQNDILRVNYVEDNDFKNLLNPNTTPVLCSLNTTPYEPHNLVTQKDPFELYNEKVKFKVGNHIFYNPQLPKNHELNFNLGDENLRINLERVSPKKRTKKILPLSIAYANINPNVQIKLNKFVASFPFTSFFCASELRCKRSEIISGEIVPIAYFGFTHETDRIDDRIHSCVVVRSCFRKDCELIYAKSPFTIIKYKKGNTSVAIGSFYIPPGDSNVWKEELSMFRLETRLGEVGKVFRKLPGVIFADINVDEENFRGTRDRIIWNLVSEKLGHLKRHKTDSTYFKSEAHSATTIDYMWTKNLDDGILNLFGGREYIGNDGHSIFEYNTNETVPGLIGTTIINKRPKLEKEKVYNLGKMYFPHLKEKLTEIERKWKRELGFDPEESLFNKNLNPNLISKFDNEYCELAFKFLEELFSTLQPDNMVEVNIYNNNKIYGPAVTRLMNILGVLNKKKAEAEEKNEDTSLLSRAIERFNRLADKYKIKDERKSSIGTHKVNDLNIFQIAKIKRPKLRETATDREIFHAEELASEFKRLYKSITDHVKNGEGAKIDITRLIPEISEEDKYSFEKWLPTWKQMPPRMIDGKIKTIEQCFNSLKPVTRGLNSSLFRDCLKMLPHEYLPIIESMIIYWASFGNYPECFLTGKLKPILKKGDINLIKNRRFISVGNMFQQLLGKAIASSLLEFVEHMNILDDRQYGFRAGRSCELAVANLIYKAKSRPDNVVTRIIFLDLSSAFFCVKKEELLRVLAKFVRKDTLLCLEKMLLPRKAVVISDGVESEPFEVEDIGVPQGEACSPLFFILVINGIFKYVANSESRIKGTDFQGFADDSQLELFSNVMKELEDLTEKGWKKTKEYVQAVGFKINPSKSEGLHFGPSDKVKKLGDFIHTCDGDIQVKKELKFLGLWIDNNLSFKPQYEYVIKKMRSIRAIVYDLVGMGTSRQILKVAISKAAGIYLYGLGIQPKWSDTQYKTLQSLIKDIIKCVYDVKFNGFKEVSQLKLLRKANWMPVKIQHGRAALMTLNRVIMNKRLLNLQKAIKEHIFFENFDEFTPAENNNRVPIIVRDRHKNKGSKIGSAFPVSVKFWFDKLPDFIKVKLGTKEFRKMVTAYCRILCWHRKDSECRHCDEFNINEDLESFTNYEKMIRAICIQNNRPENEMDRILEEETDSFIELLEVFQDPEDLIQELENA